MKKQRNILVVTIVLLTLILGSCAQKRTYTERSGVPKTVNKNFLFKVHHMKGTFGHTSAFQLIGTPDGYSLSNPTETVDSVTADGAVYESITGWDVVLKDTARYDDGTVYVDEKGDTVMLDHEMIITEVSRHGMPEEENFNFPRTKVERKKTLIKENDTLKVVYTSQSILRKVYKNDKIMLSKIRHDEENKRYYFVENQTKKYFVNGTNKKSKDVYKMTDREIKRLLVEVEEYYKIPFLVKTRISKDENSPVISWRYNKEKKSYRLDFIKDRDSKIVEKDGYFFIKDEESKFWKVEKFYKEVTILKIRLLEKEFFQKTVSQ